MLVHSYLQPVGGSVFNLVKNPPDGINSDN